MNCDEIEELAGAYALGALPADDLREVEAHLATCDRHPEIEGLRAAAASLAVATEERAPPPELKARLMEVVRREAASPAVPPAELPRPPRFRWTRPRLEFSPYGLAAALAVLVVGLLALTGYLLATDESGGERVLVANFTSGEASGRLVYVKDEGVAVMTVEGLDALPPDKTYQVWAITGETPAGIGLFDVSPEGQGSAVMETDLSDVDVVAVTIEPAGGSAAPTTDPVLKADI